MYAENATDSSFSGKGKVLGKESNYNNMKFKSWYIVLVGILLQTVFGFMLFSGAGSVGGLGAVILTVGGVVFLLATAIGIIPLVLLFFDATRKYGIIVSITFGVIGIVMQIGIIVGVFLIAAGLVAWWKKI